MLPINLNAIDLIDRPPRRADLPQIYGIGVGFPVNLTVQDMMKLETTRPSFGGMHGP